MQLAAAATLLLYTVGRQRLYTMVRNYIRKTTRGSYGSTQLQAALEKAKEGEPLKKVSRDYGVPCKTLRRHLNAAVSMPGTVQLGRYLTVLSSEMEMTLTVHIKDMEKRMYGLTTVDVRKLAFDIAESLNIDHCFNKEMKMAGVDWLQGFIKRHPGLSIRVPTATNLSRAVAFNKVKVMQFYDVYKEVLTENSYDASTIWNMDESGISNVQKPGKIIATCGSRTVAKMTSGERGQNVTIICGMSAAGQYIPPFFLFARKRMDDNLMKDAPPQSKGYATGNGWTNDEIFVKWLEHFTNVTKASVENRQLIILDGHHSHKTLQAITYARQYGITLITLPPHSTHKMQPLDKTYFRSLKAAYNAQADCWMVNHPGRRISMYDIGDIFGKAYLKVSTPEKSVSGFRMCGIWPFDNTIFTDEDFVASEVTDQPLGPSNDVIPTAMNAGIGDDHNTVNGGDQLADCSENSDITDSKEQNTGDDHGTVNDGEEAGCSEDTDMQRGITHNKEQDTGMKIIRALSPLPKCSSSQPRKRKAETSTVITSSPYKNLLVQEKEQKEAKQMEQQKKKEARQKKQQAKNKKKPQKSMGRQLKESVLMDSDSESGEEEWPCIVCGGQFADSSPGESWVQCQDCKKWAHDECSSGLPGFICPNCDSD